MLDPLIEFAKDFLEPISKGGKVVLTIVALVLIFGSLLGSFTAFHKQRWGAGIVSLGVAILIGVLSFAGFKAARSLSRGVGDNLNEGINAIALIGTVPTYLIYRKHKKLKANQEA